jgi:hypothetical protein
MGPIHSVLCNVFSGKRCNCEKKGPDCNLVNRHPDPEKPSLPLLVKLGSIIVHADEFTTPGGHEFDLVAIKQLLADPEVEAWIKDMGALLPVMRQKKAAKATPLTPPFVPYDPSIEPLNIRTWTCECKTVNRAANIRCRKCKVYRPGGRPDKL